MPISPPLVRPRRAAAARTNAAIDAPLRAEARTMRLGKMKKEGPSADARLPGRPPRGLGATPPPPPPPTHPTLPPTHPRRLVTGSCVLRESMYHPLSPPQVETP
jgi:hypothetical protein